jgi:hypothetical protein
MLLIGRFLAVTFGFLMACFVSVMIAIFALLFPEMTDISVNTIDSSAINLILGFGLVLISGFALIPALVLILITETFSIRHILAYAIGGGLAGLCSYLAFVPFDTVTMTFTGIVRHQLEVLVGAGIAGGVVYWLIAGRNAGLWRGRAVS